MLEHLLEFRRRLLYCLCFFGGMFLLCFYFANDIFQLVISPLLTSLPEKRALIATQVTSPVLTPISLAADVAFLSSAPFALMQLWCFIAPGLYQHEKVKIKSALALSLGLFCLGLLFCFYIVLPLLFQFFIHAVPKGVTMMPDIINALDFIIRMLLLFGLSFQVPLICLLLVQIQLLQFAQIKKSRPYVIVAAFIVGMLLTPPDVMSQIVLAVPLCLLFEIGLFLCYLHHKKHSSNLLQSV